MRKFLYSYDVVTQSGIRQAMRVDVLNLSPEYRKLTKTSFSPDSH